MATEKETIILDLKVDQGSAISELEKTKKVIIGTKEAQQELTAAYKKGEITQEEYAKELVRVEGILKTSQSQYNNIQKSVTGVKTQMDKLIDSNKKISQEFQNAAGNIRVAGVSLSDVTTKLASFANPATAAVGIVTALGAAYARSTIGANDLSFASNQLSAATTLVTNSFAKLISSSEDGQGIVSQFTNAILFKISPALAQISKTSAQSLEDLQKVQREAALVQAGINARLAENADLRTDISNAELLAADRLNAAQKVLDNITQNTNDKLKSINDLIDARKKVIEDSNVKESAINLLIAERSALTASEAREKSNIEKQVNAIEKAERQLNLELQKGRDALKSFKPSGDTGDQTFNDTPKTKKFDPQEQFEKDADLIAADVGLVRTAEEEKRAELLRTNALKDDLHREDQERFQQNAEMMEDNFNTLAGLFSQGSEARKLFALAGIGADTASAIASLTAMSEANPANAFTFGGAGVAQYAAGLVRILANIVAAKEFLSGSFAGGGQFTTKGPAFIMVGDNPGGRERVTVEPLSGKGQTRVHGNRIAMAGGGTLTTGFDDGGITKNAAVSQMQQALMFTNAIKNLPSPVVGVVQFAEVANQVQVKQSVAQA